MQVRPDDPEQSRADTVAARQHVLSEQVGYIHNQGVAGATAMLIIAVLYAIVLWPVTSRSLLLPWFAATVLICCGRLGLALYWRARASAHSVDFWARTGVAINALAGMAWGVAAVMLFPLDHPQQYFVATFVLVGMPAAALASLGAWLPGYSAYALAAIGPFAIWMFTLGQQHYAIVGMAAVTFCAFLLRQAQQTSGMIHRGIAQRIELEHLSRRLAQARDAAEAASRAKSNFLASMSHELRTPLNAVVGLSDLLADEPSGARGREFAGTIRQSAQSLLGVIDRVLDTGRIEAGKLELRPRGFSVRELVRDVYAMFKPEADRRRLAFRFDVDGAVPASVIGDADRLRQVLVNLVDNALKFTEAGAVSIAVTATTRGDGRYLLRFEVADTGIGIKDAQRLRLLRMFSKGESPSTSTDGGMGLGLSISAALVTLMAGEIDYRSEPGRGTKFWFTCAVGLAPPPTVSHEIMLNTAPLAPRVVPRVLLVDDNTVNLLLTRKMLESFGCQVRAAVSGADGLQRLQVESFDVVFMDIRMPGMDGIETTRVWRAHEASGGNRMPIVALTANAMVGDRQACLAAGMDDYLAKPVTLEALRRMVARHFPGAATVQPTH